MIFEAVEGNKILFILVNNTLFTNAYAKYRHSKLLSSKRWGPSYVTDLNRNPMSNWNDRLIFGSTRFLIVLHTTPYKDQILEIAQPIP